MGKLSSHPVSIECNYTLLSCSILECSLIGEDIAILLGELVSQCCADEGGDVGLRSV